MAYTDVSIRMDSDVKTKAQELFDSIGLDMTTAVNMFLRQSIRQNGMPFEPAPEVPNAETIEAIEEVQRMKENPSLYKSYTDIDEMMRELLSS